jgi:predicted dehydrogenase
MLSTSRRTFLGTAGVSAAILPRHVLGGPGYRAPSDRVNIAGIGVGGVGKTYLEGVNSEHIMALCDVDLAFAQPVFHTYPEAKQYQDFRIMLDELPEIDAVVIGTPDHSHAVIAMEAMERGKHVYCAKPLTRTMGESRRMLESARKTGVATQMSTQRNAENSHRKIAEWIEQGAIGDVHEVHIWSNRPIWPQGVERPRESPSCPGTLDWDLWIGPAVWRPYHPAYHPFKFRGWYDFGSGALGDMGCHHFDPVFRALKLKTPHTVHASSTRLWDETFPVASIVHYDFPARGAMPPVRVTWYDGKLMPPRPKELDENTPMGNRSGGILFEGSEGKLLVEGIGQNPRLLPESLARSFGDPKETIPRSIGHYKEWIRACQGGEPAGVHFEYGAPLTEVVLLGNVAIRTGKVLHWNPDRMTFGNPEADALISEPYRHGWSL